MMAGGSSSVALSSALHDDDNDNYGIDNADEDNDDYDNYSGYDDDDDNYNCSESPLQSSAAPLALRRHLMHT